MPIFLYIKKILQSMAGAQHVESAQQCGSASTVMVSILGLPGFCLPQLPCWGKSHTEARPSLVTENRACQPAGRQESNAGNRQQMKAWQGANVIPSRGQRVRRKAFLPCATGFVLMCPVDASATGSWVGKTHEVAKATLIFQENPFYGEEGKHQGHCLSRFWEHNEGCNECKVTGYMA